MRIFITLDYELYFGDRTGSVEKCITGPTEMLTENIFVIYGIGEFNSVFQTM